MGMLMAWHGYHNQTIPFLHLNLVWCIFSWIVCYLVFLWLVLTSRERRMTTFLTGTASITSGALLSIGVIDCNWLSGAAVVVDSLTRYQGPRMTANMSVHIGLQSINITLISSSPGADYYFNEILKFGHVDPTLMYRQALERGLPNSILTVVEHLLFTNNGIEKAGSSAQYLLTACLTCWLVNQLLYILLPHYTPVSSSVIGILILSSVVFYLAELDSRTINIHLPGSVLAITLGRSVYLVLLSSGLHLVPGIMFWFFSVSVDNAFQLDFQTPWDQHTLMMMSRKEKEERATKPVNIETSRFILKSV